MLKKSSIKVKDEQVSRTTVENSGHRAIIKDSTGHAKAVATMSTAKQPPVNQARISSGASTQSSSGVKID